MARTKASVGAKVAAGKSSKARCTVTPVSSGGGSSGSADRSSRSQGGGNPVCPRETPKWQRPITNFFIGNEPAAKSGCSNEDEKESSPKARKSKRNVIESDDEDTNEIEVTDTDDKEENDKAETKDDKAETKNDKAETKNDETETKNDKEKPTNNVLDETFELDPLNDENSHKIDEYYNKNGDKGKGKGKKSTKNKENVSENRRDSLKRDSDDVVSGDDPVQANKRVKVH